MNKKGNSYSFFYRSINKFLITCLVTIICLIGFKKSSSFKSLFYDNVIDVNFDFAYVNDLYKKYFGGVLPFSDYFMKTQTVFNETLIYNDSHSYLDGVSLSVGSGYLVPSISDGLVIFIGNKEGYGNTIIVQSSNGVDVWYSNVVDISVNLYEYVSKGSILGSCDNQLVLVFKRDGNVLDYQEYI